MTARVYAAIEPEIIDMVVALKQLGITLGVISNAGDLDAAPWDRSELAPLFDDFVASHRFGLLKRDERIYRLACERLGVAPHDAIFVGDGGGNELQGAVEAGVETLWCSWFLDRWPEGIRPNSFPGDDWRQYRDTAGSPFRRLTHPNDLLRLVKKRS